MFKEVILTAEETNASNLLYFDEKRDQITIEKISEVQATKIRWLWKDTIAYGKMTLFAGEPGVGKSQLLAYIASIVSVGGKFHFQTQNVQPSKVLLISGEDNSEDTLKPRLMALNANLDNIHNVKGIKRIDQSGHPFFDVICIIDHMPQLESLIIEHKYKLIIIDPISVYLGSVDENKNKEIRAALALLTALAERHDIALILNSHFSKPSGNAQKNAIYRVMGSIGFAAAARIVFGVMKDDENPEKRLFIPIKNNIGDDKTGYAYKIKSILLENEIETSKIEFLAEKVYKTANQVMNTSAVQNSPKTDEAKQFLLEILKEGSVSLSEIRTKADQEEISTSRLYKAKNELKIYETASLTSKRGKIWMLPPS